MSAPNTQPATPGGGLHPAVVGRRIHDLAAAGLMGAVLLGIALAISTQVSEPNLVATVAIILGVAAIVGFLVSTRYEVTLSLVALYLGLLDGPVKLLSASQGTSAIRNVFILAIAVGMLVRRTVSKERMKMPALSGWIVAFAVVVLAESLNPNTGGTLKILGGFRQELEWIPLFFFAYLIMRNKENFRKMFLLFGVIALANGAVGAYQSRLSPAGLGTWGPGYSARVSGKGGVAGRSYSVEGTYRPRPPALGPDSGFGGGVGVLAFPGLLALLTVGHLRRRWVAVLMCSGAIVGISTSASRSAFVVAVIALLSYGILSVAGGIRVSKPLATLLAAVGLAAVVGSVLLSAEGFSVFHRQETIVNSNGIQASGAQAKEFHLAQIPRDIANEPFGIGLGTTGSAGGFGGKQKVRIEGGIASGESAYNLEVLEAGLPGLLLWVGLSINVILLAFRRLRYIADIELRTYLVAAFAVYIAYTAQGFAGPTLAVAPAGTYLWFAAGIAAYWFAGPGRAAALRPAAPTPVDAKGALT